jgi:hypothetical protein
MGWAVVLDPYVVDLADNDVVCQKIVKTVYCSAEHAFVVDKGQVLLEKYEQLARSKPEGWVRQVYKYLVESQPSANVSSTAHILYLKPLIPEDAYCCDSNADRVERIMVRLASGQQKTALVTLDDASRSQCQTPWLFWTHECYQKVLNQHKVCFKFTDSWDWLHDPHPPFPNTKEGLENFLKRCGDGQIRETEQLEFKCPDNPAEGLTKTVVDSARQAVCAMANSNGGYVFIGVKDNGDIPGIALIYKNKRRSLDCISRIILGNHEQFTPDMPVDWPWGIQITEDRYVFALRISNKRVKNYLYKNRRYRRVGTQSLRE